jgi:competence protein ComEC
MTVSQGDAGIDGAARHAGRAGAAMLAAAAAIEAQRPHFVLWLPVFFGTGIGIYFALPVEPGWPALAVLVTAAALCLATATRTGLAARMLLVLAACLAAGVVAGSLRASAVAAPVLAHTMTVAVEGRIVGIDRSSSDRLRVTLSDVVLHGVEPEATPAQVRVSVHESTPVEAIVPGMRIIGQARLSPPSAPSEPGGFDFRRLAWFARLGAVGYTNTPMVEIEAPERLTGSERVLTLRLALSETIQEAIPGRNGGFASAILTGDRSGIDPVALEHLRATNLAHLLAISGLHMGLLTGFVFALLRYGLALVPVLALRLPVKKIAAGTALAAGLGYLVLSGANVATQRAFVMTAVVLVAVMIDRPAITLRSVAIAAAIVLIIRPESLVEAGFQMSFAATTALVATFDWLRGQAWWRETQGHSWRFVRPVIGVAATSTIAGVATAPISAFHFNIMSQYGLIANVLAVPAMGLMVMPAAVLAGMAGLVGLAAPALWLMDAGIGYILAIAEFVAGLEGAVRAVPAGPWPSLALIAAGGVILVLWIGRGRAAGVLPVLAGLFLWAAQDRPDILVTEDGRLFGVMTPEGRALNTARGNGFAAATWLGNDGDAAGQEAAAARGDIARSRGRAEIRVDALGPLVYRGSRDPDAADRAECATAAILIAPDWREPPEGPCLFIGRDLLRREGALAIRLSPDGPVIDGALRRDVRPWAPPSPGAGPSPVAGTMPPPRHANMPD